MKNIRKKKRIRLNQEFKLITQDLSSEQNVDTVAMSIMELFEHKVSTELFCLLKDVLLGFNDDMQLEIADDLLDFVSDRVIHTTGCPSADAALRACYQWIATEQGFPCILTH